MNFSIGLTGLEVAQRAIELIGTNIANAGTEGYHRQTPRIAPRDFGSAGIISLGGAQIAEVRRSLDVLVEQELLRQQPQFGEVSQELRTLQTIESIFGDLNSEGLATAMNRFFNALRELAAQPNSEALQEQVVWAADTLATQFHHLGQFLADLDHHIVLEAQHTVEQANSLAAEIAELNGVIQAITARGGNANLLADQRDQAIMELAELIDVRPERQPGGTGVANVVAWGTPVVVANSATELEVAITEGGELGVSVKGADYFLSDLRGGRLGGLLALKNETLSDVRGKLDALAAQVIRNVNKCHAQGVGMAGSFTQLTGWTVGAGVLSSWDSDISTGDFYIRVTDQDTGNVTRHTVHVDPDNDDIQDIVDKINDLPSAPLAASVLNSALRIQVTDPDRYRFDFLPAPTRQPSTSNLTGMSEPIISGLYTGQANQTLTATIVGSGTVGLTAGLTVEVEDGQGVLIESLNVGDGYVPGSILDLGNGISMAFTSGTLNSGEVFTIEALADSDTSGILAAAGMNAFFSGDSALMMAVEDEVRLQPQRLAIALGQDMTDNANVRRMAELGEQRLAALGNVSPTDYFRLLVTGVGQQVVVMEARCSSLEAVSRQLVNQRDSISGVNINEEVAKLLIFEQMFQGMAKFMSSQEQVMQHLMELL